MAATLEDVGLHGIWEGPGSHKVHLPTAGQIANPDIPIPPEIRPAKRGTRPSPPHTVRKFRPCRGDGDSSSMLALDFFPPPPIFFFSVRGRTGSCDLAATSSLPPRTSAAIAPYERFCPTKRPILLEYLCRPGASTVATTGSTPRGNSKCWDRRPGLRTEFLATSDVYDKAIDPATAELLLRPQ